MGRWIFFGLIVLFLWFVGVYSWIDSRCYDRCIRDGGSPLGCLQICERR